LITITSFKLVAVLKLFVITMTHLIGILTGFNYY